MMRLKPLAISLPIGVLIYLLFQISSESLQSSGLEPERLKQQFNQQKIEFISNQEAIKLIEPPVNAQEQCIEMGNFTPNELIALKTKLTEAAIDASTVHESQHTSTAVTQFLVVLNTTNTANLQDRRVQELKKLGFSPYVSTQDAQLKNVIIIGEYTQEATAINAIRKLETNGVKTVRLFKKQLTKTQSALKITPISPLQKTALGTLLNQYNGKWLRICDQ
jgi:hypothetical protein